MPAETLARLTRPSVRMPRPAWPGARWPGPRWLLAHRDVAALLAALSTCALAYRLALLWHRPDVGGPSTPAAVAVVAVLAGLLLLETALLTPRLVPLAKPVAALVAIGVLVRSRVAPESFGRSVLLLTIVVGAFPLFVRLGQWLRPSRALRVALWAGVVGSAVLLRLNGPTNGAWINASVGGVTFQPAEFIRIALVLLIADAWTTTGVSLEDVRWRWGPLRVPPPRVLLLGLVPVGAGLLLFAGMRDLGPAVLLVAGATVVLVRLGRNGTLLGVALAGFAAVAGLLVTVGNFGYVETRVQGWLHPFPDGVPTATGWALLAFARGGLFGRGPGLGRVETLGLEARNDWILSVVAEELGVVGLLAVLVVVALMLRQLLALWRDTDGSFASAASLGLLAMTACAYVLPALFSIGIIPVIGVATPLLSDGATAELGLFVVLGLIGGMATVRAPAPGVLPIAPVATLPPRPQPWRDAVGRHAFLSAFLALVCTGPIVLQPIAARAITPNDPSEAAAQRARVLAPRGDVLSADGRVLATTQGAGRGAVRSYPEGAGYAEAAGYLTFANGGRGVEWGLAPWTECGPPRAGVIEALFGPRCQPTDLRLTLRHDVQSAALAALGDRRGAVVAIDPQTGAVLALVSAPSFDPNTVVYPPNDADAYRAAGEQRQDLPQLGATGRSSPPGSTFKLVTALAALEARGEVEPAPHEDALRYEDANGPHELHNDRGGTCGGTVVEALRDSCNTAFARFARAAGPEALVATATALGFGATEPVDGITVEPSTVGEPGGYYPAGDECAIELAAIGQGCVRVTPFEMAVATACIAGSGACREPHVVADAARGGDVVWRRPPAPAEQPFSPEAVAVVRAGMISAASEGSARSAAIPGVAVAAKTGTATSGLGFSNGWMVAFAPVEDPQVAVAVLVEGAPGADRSGGRDAGPVARATIEAALGSGAAG